MKPGPREQAVLDYLQRPLGVSRAELFWIAWLYLADAWREEQIRQFTELLDRVYVTRGQKLWELATRESPMLRALRKGSGS